MGNNSDNNQLIRHPRLDIRRVDPDVSQNDVESDAGTVLSIQLDRPNHSSAQSRSHHYR